MSLELSSKSHFVLSSADGRMYRTTPTLNLSLAVVSGLMYSVKGAERIYPLIPNT